MSTIIIISRPPNEPNAPELPQSFDVALPKQLEAAHALLDEIAGE